ncbi:hypothetical protein OG963_44040 (plasmid) [Streptomyces sp. NBC_01707]|uniref:hypothetical protein n=1 Tax=Streptomyces sp. NBC_01707 TaxID=2975914 RepID=UPI00352CB0E4
MVGQVIVTWQLGDVGVAGEVLSRDGWQALRDVSEWRIRERSFFGDVTLRVGDTEFRFQRAAIVDFIMSWRFGLEQLTLRSQGCVELADNGEQVSLFCDASTVILSSPYDQRSASCLFVDLLAAILRFAQTALDEVTRAYPDLLVHDLVDGLFRGLGMRELGREQYQRHSAAAAKCRSRET